MKKVYRMLAQAMVDAEPPKGSSLARMQWFKDSEKVAFALYSSDVNFDMAAYMALMKELQELRDREQKEKRLRMVVGVSDWPETLGERFNIFPVLPGESDEEAIARAKAVYSEELVCEIEDRYVR